MMDDAGAGTAARTARAQARESGVGAADRHPWRAAGLDRGGPTGARTGPRSGRLHRDLPLREGSSDPDLEDARSDTTRCSASWTTPAKRCPGMLREGRAGSNTTADHITVLDDALTQIPDALPARHPDPDPRRLRRLHPRLPRPHPQPARARRATPGSPSVSRSPNRSAQAILTQTPSDWVPALDSDGEPPRRRRDLRTDRPRPRRRLPARDPVHRPPRTAAPRRATVAVRHHRRHTPPSRRHRHPTRRRIGAVPRGPPPRPRPRRRPHQHRQRHRLRPVPVPRLRDQPAWLQLALTGIDLLAWTQTPPPATATSPPPNPRNCATDSCTSPPASPAPPAAPGSASPKTGPGQPISSPHSTASPRYPARSAEHRTRDPANTLEEPGHTPGQNRAQSSAAHP